MKEQNTSQSVSVMAESNGKTLCIRNSGLVTAADHSEYMYKKIARLVEKYGSFNLLVLYADDYKGYTPEAADSSIRSMLEYGKNVVRLAYVNPPETRIKLHKMLPEVFNGEIRFFDKDQLQEALAWVKTENPDD